MITVETFSDVRTATDGVVAIVPTMGYLHEGHLSLIEAASELADTTVVSLFVNPTQFGDPSDLDEYPRDGDRDAALAHGAGADILFTPAFEEVYPSASTVVSVGTVGETMEGRRRPGHFDGVATVVAKLLGGIRPGIGLFGKKDAQQLAVVRTMATDLRFPVDIVGLSTVRELDGLALSSRNTRIDRRDRQDAAALSGALFAAADAFDAGRRDAASLTSAASNVLHDHPNVEVEYVSVADVRSAELVDVIAADAFIAVAARVGGVRLIDNVSFDMKTETADRGIRLNRSSILYEEG